MKTKLILTWLTICLSALAGEPQLTECAPCGGLPVVPIEHCFSPVQHGAYRENRNSSGSTGQGEDSRDEEQKMDDPKRFDDRIFYAGALLIVGELVESKQ